MRATVYRLLFLCCLISLPLAPLPAQLEPMVTPAQIRRHNIQSITVTLYNGDAEGNRHGRGEKERYYEYDPMGNIVERNFYPEKPGYNRTTIFEYRKGSLWRESLNKHGDLVESIEYINYAGKVPTLIRRKDGMGKLLATEERTYIQDTLLAGMKLYDSEKQLVNHTSYTYVPETARLQSQTEQRGGMTRKVVENAYDPHNRLIAQKEYDNTGQHVRNVTYNYDEEGRQVRRVSRTLDGKLAEDLYYTWEEGLLAEEYVQYADIDLRDSRRHSYNEQGLHSSTLAFEASTQHWRVATFTYTFYEKK
ncbi:MAG: hypothetical protein KF690_03300 [Bacteroidetes bacterium]|nr:hypothetical protein [Bacteroidota bacterium]